MSRYRIAVIPGDGIGLEVVPEGIRVLDAAAHRYGIELHWQWFDFSSCEYYARHGQMLPDDWFDVLQSFECNLLRRRRLAGNRAGSHFALGFAVVVSPRV